MEVGGGREWRLDEAESENEGWRRHESQRMEVAGHIVRD